MKASNNTNKKQITALEQLHQSIAESEELNSKLKQVEKALKNSEERFKALAENVPIGIYYSDLKGTFLYGNKKAEEIVGYKKDELIGKSFLKLKLISKKDMVRAAKLLRLNNRSKTTGPDEFVINRKDGTKKIIEINTSVITLSGQKTIIGMAQDITERKRMEEVLRDSEKKYRELINGMNDTAWVIDFNGNFIDVNDAAVELLGYSRKELLAMKPYDIDTTLDGEEISGLIKGMPKDKLQVFETTHTTKDGKTIPVEIKSSLVTYQGQQAILSIARDITERKQTEEALRENEERFRRVVETMKVGLGAIDENGVLTYVNEYLAKMLGYSIAEMIGRSTLDFYEEKSRKIQEEIFKKRRAGMRDPTPYEVTWRRKDGQKVYAILSPTPMFDADGHYTASFAIHTDITERKRMEQALRETEERYRSLVDNVDLGINLIDLDHNIIMVNCTSERHLNKHLSQTIGKKCYREFERRDTVCPHCPGVQTIATGQPAEVEIDVTGDDQSRFNIRIQTFPVLGQDGTVTAFIEVVEDITERKRMEEALRESEEEFRTFMETASDLMHISDKDLNFTYVNEAMARTLGYSKEEMIGMNMAQVVKEEVVQKAFKRNLEVLMKQGEISFETIRIAKDGKEIHGELKIVAIFDNDGAFAGTRGVFRDITERKQAEAELRESEERHRTLFEHAGFAISLFDTETAKRVAFNAMAHESLGYTREEFEELTAVDITVNKAPEETTRHFKRIIEKGSDLYEMQLVTKKGEIRDMLISAVPIRIHGRNFIQMIRVDITDQKRAEQSLRENEERYKALYEDNPSMYFTVDSEGTVLSVNRFGAEQLGYTVEELVGKSVLDVFYEDDKKAAQQQLTTCIQNPQELFHWEIRKVRKDATMFWVKETARTVRCAEGNPIVLVVCEDITKRKQAEEYRKESFERLRESLESTVSALASAFEVRDPYTAGHQHRVTDLACSIAEEMGLAEERIDGIRMAGLIHDIGKINIPAEILNKPGQLTEIEYSLFKNHPQVGHDVLQRVEFPWPVAQIVLQHHERMDGSGYPQGLKGEDIMMEARILAVADIVEAIASHRPYRPARGVGDALEEILHNKGTLYDPEVVDACLRVFYEKGFKFEQVLKVATAPRMH